MVAVKEIKQVPTMTAMISNAITSLKERTGSSRQAVKKFIISNYNKPDTNMLKGRLLFALKKMVRDGRVEMVKGSFKLTQTAKQSLLKAPKKKETKLAAPKVKKVIKKTSKGKEEKIKTVKGKTVKAKTSVKKPVKKVAVKPKAKKAIIQKK